MFYFFASFLHALSMSLIFSFLLVTMQYYITRNREVVNKYIIISFIVFLYIMFTMWIHDCTYHCTILLISMPEYRKCCEYRY